MKILRVGIFITLPVLGFFAYSAVSPDYRYRVVIDPGHGGLSLNPVSLHGDKYDPVEKKYLSAYQQGAEYKNLHESEIAYEIALQVKDILDLTKTPGGREKFHQVLLKYDPLAETPREPIQVILSRKKGYPVDDYDRYEGKTDKDYNADFRLFDFPDFVSGDRLPGLISRINELRPDLVVSLHLDSEGPTYGAMASVVTPGYDTYKTALEYANADAGGKRKILREFKKGPYENWIQMNGSRSGFEWFLCDAWIYFTGFWSVRNGLAADPSIFRGIRQDYVDWAYQGNSWRLTPEETRALKSRGLPSLQNFQPTGAFWERERSQPEAWRREGGIEGIGGDNLYSSNELLRFIRLGLLANRAMSEKSLPDVREPHWSTWSLPTYVNAVSAYIELGFLNNRYDRARIEKWKSLHAEAIAAGIYSLLYGLHRPDVKIPDMPVGKPLDLEKYKNIDGRDYFKDVVR